MTKTWVPFGIAFVAFVTACSTVTSRPVSGVPVDRAKVADIVPNETTRGEIEEWFGTPTRILHHFGGAEELRYAYTGYVDSKLEAGVYMREVIEKENALLRVVTSDDVVIEYAYTNSLRPQENISRPDLPRTYVVLLPDADDHVGEVALRDASGERVQGEANQATGFEGGRDPHPLSEAQVKHTFARVLAAEPRTPGRFVLYFESGTTRLTTASREDLVKIRATVSARATPPDVDVIGHTDRSATEQYNLALSRRRAQQVRDELIAAGLDAERIQTSWHGEQNPLVPTPDGVREPRNRRVEVIIR